MTRLLRALPGLVLSWISSCASNGATVGTGAGPTPDYDVEHYRIELEVDPLRRRIDGECTIRAWSSADDLARIDLALAGLDVRSVRDSSGRRLRFERNERDERLSVALARPLSRGEHEEFTVVYGGTPQRGLWFARERDGTPTQLFTHGQCRDARGWFPCQDEPFERATSELIVTLPAAWTSIAAGERIERTEHGLRATERWRVTFPHPAYLETLVAGVLHVETDAWDGLPLVYACAPDLAEYLAPTFEETGAILEFFSTLTGVRYPYPKYAQACVDDFPFGGMENVSATTLTDTILPDARGFGDLSPQNLIAHEAAHQWFGDLVTCRDWSEIWLNEGFATYFAALYEEETAGRDAFEATMRAARDLYTARDVGANRRAIVQATSGDPLEGFFTGHVYEGSAVRLHYLRGVFGDEAFFAAVRRYLASRRGGSVTTADLRAAFEEVTGRDLAAFFRQWFLEPGHPRVSARWSYDGAETVLVLEQTIPERASGTPIFDIELEVEIRAGGSSRVERVRFDRRRQEFRFVGAQRPDWVLVDPRDRVPMELDERMSVSTWLVLARDGHVGARLRAIGALDRGRTRDLRPDEIDVVLRTFVRLGAEDESEYVRTAAIEALARGHGPGRRADVRDLCAYAVQHDVHPSVVEAAWRTLRSLGPDETVHALAAAALPRARGWNLRAAIAGTLASSAPDGAFEFLVEQLRMRSAHGIHEAQILSFVLATEDPRARALLRTWLQDDSKPDAPRAVAVRELSRTRCRDEELAAVIALLESPRVRLRREAIHALGASRDPRARSALERHLSEPASAIERIAIDDVLGRTGGDP